MAMADVVEATLAGMGFELVEARASGGGRHLSIFIDKPGGITVQDCAEASRQLTRVFAVEGIDYDRLEVSSPGLDRPLRKAEDFARFGGRRAELRLRLPDATGRRNFAGVLRGVAQGRVSLELDGQMVSLALEDLERARLVPDL